MICSPVVLGLSQRDAGQAVWVVHTVHFALAWEARKPQPFFACRLFVALSMNVPFVLLTIPFLCLGRPSLTPCWTRNGSSRTLFFQSYFVALSFNAIAGSLQARVISSYFANQPTPMEIIAALKHVFSIFPAPFLHLLLRNNSSWWL